MRLTSSLPKGSLCGSLSINRGLVALKRVAFGLPKVLIFVFLTSYFSEDFV